jgi:hypothetical protein
MTYFFQIRKREAVPISSSTTKPTLQNSSFCVRDWFWLLAGCGLF